MARPSKASTRKPLIYLHPFWGWIMVFLISSHKYGLCAMILTRSSPGSVPLMLHSVSPVLGLCALVKAAPLPMAVSTSACMIKEQGSGRLVDPSCAWRSAPDPGFEQLPQRTKTIKLSAVSRKNFREDFIGSRLPVGKTNRFYPGTIDAGETCFCLCPLF